MAALDRQHPRDLFDVMQLYEHEGITPAIRRAFVIYLASHPRPVHEVLSPKLRDISLANAAPEWDLLGVPHAHELPALRWKLKNLEQLAKHNPKKFSTQSRQLDELLNGNV